MTRLRNCGRVTGSNPVLTTNGETVKTIIKNRITMDRSQWFKDRIGKTIYRNSNGCECEICKHVQAHGRVIDDEMHADYLDMCEDASLESPNPIRYFDTIEEVKEYEQSKISS